MLIFRLFIELWDGSSRAGRLRSGDRVRSGIGSREGFWLEGEEGERVLKDGIGRGHFFGFY